jgi:hypothetical protein
MNCTTFQHRLLGCERLGDPPAELQEHLSSCSECRAWQRKAISVENNLRSLPVPPSTGASAFVQDFLTDRALGPDGLPWWVQPHRRRGRRVGERLRQRVALAFALAAGLAIFALGWWVWPHRGSPEGSQVAVRDPAAQRRDQIQQKLAGTRTAGERVQKLAEFAEELHRSAQDVSTDATRVAELAHFYTEVIRDHLLPDAAAIPVADRAALLGKIAERLRRTESDALRLKVYLQLNRNASADGFADIALAAHEGSLRLAALARGETL